MNISEKQFNKLKVTYYIQFHYALNVNEFTHSEETLQQAGIVFLHYQQITPEIRVFRLKKFITQVVPHPQSFTET